MIKHITLRFAKVIRQQNPMFISRILRVLFGCSFPNWLILRSKNKTRYRLYLERFWLSCNFKSADDRRLGMFLTIFKGNWEFHYFAKLIHEFFTFLNSTSSQFCAFIDLQFSISTPNFAIISTRLYFFDNLISSSRTTQKIHSPLRRISCYNEKH